MSTSHLKNEDPIVQRLNAVVDSYPDLRVPARLYQAILPLIRDAVIHVSPLQLDTVKVNAFLETGVPVLSGIELELEFQELKELLLQLISAVESLNASEEKPRRWKVWQHTSNSKEKEDQAEYRSLNTAAARIRKSYTDGCLDLGEVLEFAASGKYEGVSEIAGKLQLDIKLLYTLAQNALKPVLHSCRREITPLITQQLHWDKDFCFICGSRATIGELQENDQVKHLRCGQCGADWHFNRLQCLHCGNMNHATQQNLYVDGCDSRRIEVCDVCHGYLKVITSFIPTPPEMLAVEDLATLHLDFIAHQKGYVKAGVETIRI